MIRVVTAKYTARSAARQEELNKCIEKNTNNKFIDEFHLIESEDKITYNQYFEFLNNLTGPDDINIVINSDIYFDETVKLLDGAISDNELWVAAVRDWKSDEYAPRRKILNSQDIWAFKGKTKLNVPISTGVCGCDNAIIYMANQQGVIIRNCSLEVKAYHLHLVSERTYLDETGRPKDKAPTPWYGVEQTPMNIIPRLCRYPRTKTLFEQ